MANRDPESLRRNAEHMNEVNQQRVFNETMGKINAQQEGNSDMSGNQSTEDQQGVHVGLDVDAQAKLAQGVNVNSGVAMQSIDMQQLMKCQSEQEIFGMIGMMEKEDLYQLADQLGVRYEGRNSKDFIRAQIYDKILKK